MMALLALDMGDETDAARIVFVPWVVKTLAGRYRVFTHGLTSVGCGGLRGAAKTGSEGLRITGPRGRPVHLIARDGAV
jgi:hypothetical protein